MVGLNVVLMNDKNVVYYQCNSDLDIDLSKARVQ